MSMRTRILLSGLLIALLAGHVAAQGRKLYPVDGAAQDRSFKVFRDKLLAAARKQDKKFILSILDPNIHLSFGGDYGPKDFKTMWKIDEPDSPFWDELTTILELGGEFETIEGRREFVAPYVTSSWPDNRELDVFDYVAVIGSDVRLRAAPGLNASIVTSLSYDIVKTINTKPSEVTVQKDGFNWVKVITNTGKQGYVADKYIRSPIAYRAHFRKIKGSWRMTAFIGGD